MPTALDLLRLARTRIEKGWAKHNFGLELDDEDDLIALGSDDVKEHGRRHQPCQVCSLGALYWAEGALDADGALLGEAQNVLAHAVYCLHGTTCIATYNDDPATTRADVLQVFDAAIEAVS